MKKKEKFVYDKGALMATNIQAPGVTITRGKVRDIYDLGKELLIVATDRISAFDVVMKTGIPGRGQLLTFLTDYWLDVFGNTKPAVAHHRITTEVGSLPKPFREYPQELWGRVMLVKKGKVIPVECVVRGYLAGSAWRDYQQTCKVCWQELPAGLKQCDKLPEPLFTPATKAEAGDHDENISLDRCEKIIGTEAFCFVSKMSKHIFATASEILMKAGIIMADTKFEFAYELNELGKPTIRLMLVDEVLTPDSSRFWPADRYEPGRDQESFDKQFMRNYLESINFDKEGPGVELPDEIAEQTKSRYLEAFSRITGRSLGN